MHCGMEPRASGNMHGGKLGAALSRKSGMLSKNKAMLNNFGNVHMAAFSPSGEGAITSLKKFASF